MGVEVDGSAGAGAASAVGAGVEVEEGVGTGAAAGVGAGVALACRLVSLAQQKGFNVTNLGDHDHEEILLFNLV